MALNRSAQKMQSPEVDLTSFDSQDIISNLLSLQSDQMKKQLFTLFLVAASLTAFAQSPIYNPDADGNGIITQADLLSFLSVFDTEFTGAPCNCGCYANPFYAAPPTGDTLSSMRLLQTSSTVNRPIRLDFVAAPFGTGSMPFLTSIRCSTTV